MQMEGVYALTSFFGSRAQPERDVRFSYCAMAIAYMLDDWSMLCLLYTSDAADE